MLKTMFITNDPRRARIAEENSVDVIWIDLEIRNKEERQAGTGSLISHHKPEDIDKVKKVLKKAELLVRLNPMFDGTKDEVDDAISRGADAVMLPMYNSVEDVERFLGYVDGRAKVCLLLETIGAEECLEQTLRLKGIDRVHVGMNDLHIQYHNRFMFELLSNGKIDNICSKVRNAGVEYGFGGVARLGEGLLPAEEVLGEHYRLGSSSVILSRSFFAHDEDVSPLEAERLFSEDILNIRNYERFLQTQNPAFFEDNRKKVKASVNAVLESCLV